MKAITKHQHLHRARNRCNVAMGAALERAMQPLRQASNDRWDQLETDLRLQRCKLNESIATHPFRMQYENRMKMERLFNYIERYNRTPTLW